MPAQIDHIILLLPYASLLHPPAWLTSNFTISPGGRHLDGRTENKLILFADGTYLELISFINDDPQLRAGHHWGSKPFGLIDFALTDPDGFDHSALRQRIRDNKLDVDYTPLIEGGRRRDDGKEVKWRLSIPASPQHRGQTPFWCQDETPRTLRVDVQKPGATEHPSGVLGIAQFTVMVPRGEGEMWMGLYGDVVQTKAVRVFGTARLSVETPVQVAGLVKPWWFVEEAGTEEEVRRVRERGAGLVEVALRVGVEGEVGVARAAVREEGVWIHFLK